jgi:class 3 adenylate cyclase/DNA-binding winged helix-turn-helix (wHTH) protein/tetratricopeptide (TPR) repeat protein
MIYTFGDYELDTRLYELRHAGQPCKLEPQVFNVLVHLVQHRDRVVTKHELLEHLWPDQFISEATLNHRLMAARKAIGDSGRTQRCIKTLHGRGYRFVVPVQERPAEAETTPEAAGSSSAEESKHCAACQHTNTATAQFCVACGARLVHTCPRCEQVVRLPATFCSACGQRLQAAAEPPAPSVVPPASSRPDIRLTSLVTSEGERKQVTVLCCVLANATDLAEHLDSEAMHTLLQRLYELILDEVQRYAGTVTQFLPDGCMALFGVPVAHEDHARRAVLAALGIQRRLHDDTMTPDAGESTLPHVRIGLHTGPIIVGTIGESGQTTYTTVGDTIPLATRVQRLALPDTIQLTEVTARLVGDHVRREEAGTIDTESRTAAMRVYRVTGERDVRPGLDMAPERGLAPFVGRQHELDVLHERFGRAQSGSGQAVSIIGEAGLGKSRLLYEFRRLLAAEEHTFLEGRCSPYGTAVAYLPIVDLLQQVFRLGADETGATVADKVRRGLQALGADPAAVAPYLLHLLAAEQAREVTATLAPEVLKRRIFESLQLTVLHLAAQCPLVIAFEDLHLADRTSEEFVTFLLEHIAASPVLLLCTYRPDFVSTWSRKSYHSTMTLTRLTPQESQRLLTLLLGAERVQEALTELVIGRSDGVPFFLEELVHALRETGAIETQEDQWRFAAAASATQVPATVQDVLMARIDRLPEGAKRVLQIGAVIGREFSWELLQAVAGVDEAALRSFIAALTDAELIYEYGFPPQATYRFKHALTQEVAYNSLLAAARRRLHQQIGDIIVARHGDDLEAWGSVLAHHFARSGESARALPYLVQTGERALRVYANAEALHAFTQAVEMLHMLPATDATRRQGVELSRRLASLHVLLGHYSASLPYFEQALEQAREAGDIQAVAHLETRIGRVRYNMGDYEDAIACLQRALALAQRLHDTTRMAICYQSLGYVYFSSGRLATAIESFTNALHISEASGNRFGVVAASTFLSNAQARAGNVAEALRWGQHALELGEQLQDDRRLAWAGIMLAQASNLAGDFAASASLLERALRLCDKVGDFLGRAWVSIWLGELRATRDRDFAGALACATQVITMGRESGGFQHEVSHQCARAAEYLVRLGRYQEAFDYCHEALEIARHTANTLEYGYAYMLLAEIHASEAYEDWQQADWYLHQSLTAFREVGAQVDVGRAHLAGARIARRRGGGSARHWAETARAIFADRGARVLLQEAETWLAGQ